jgi:uncharacterized protein (TIGR03435 family)
MIRQAIIGLAFVGGVAVLSAEGPIEQSPTPTFEVASVKPNRERQLLRFSILPGGQLITTGYTLIDIIRHAFDTNPEQLIGAPDWAMREAFDIIARAAHGTSGGSRQTMEMLRSLLRTRFKLQAHVESREMPVYVMRVAQPGKIGPQLRPSDIDCGGFVAGRSEAPEQNAGPQCGNRISQTNVAGTYRFQLRGRSMPRLAADLQGFARRPVIDETGLSGLFDADIEFALDVSASIPPEGITVFTAVEEQLGLKLEPTRGSVEVMVIDHIERPTPD